MRLANYPLRWCFTQLELLVVLSIIGLLASMLLPVVNRARERSNRVKCASNLKQIGLALEMYWLGERLCGLPRTYYTANVPLDLTTRGYLDRSGPFDTTTGINNVGASFFYALKTQDLTPNVFVCPSSRTGSPGFAGTLTGVQASSNFQGFSAASFRQDCTYSYQVPFPSTTATADGFRFNNINAYMPSDFALAADINPGTVVTVARGTPVTAIAYNAPAWATAGSNSRNHFGQGQNVLYGDSHVEWQPTPFAGPYRTTPVAYRDNIYTGGPAGTAGVGGSVDGSVVTLPCDRRDSILLPTDN